MRLESILELEQILSSSLRKKTYNRIFQGNCQTNRLYQYKYFIKLIEQQIITVPHQIKFRMKI